MDWKSYYSVKLYFLGYIIALEAAGADLECEGGTAEFGLNFNQIRFPGAPGMVLGMADFIAGYCVFSADIASP